jgi:hypothetical protein
MITTLSIICGVLVLALFLSFINSKFDERDRRALERENKQLTEELERAHRELRQAEEKR